MPSFDIIQGLSSRLASKKEDFAYLSGVQEYNCLSWLSQMSNIIQEYLMNVRFILVF